MCNTDEWESSDAGHAKLVPTLQDRLSTSTLHTQTLCRKRRAEMSAEKPLHKIRGSKDFNWVGNYDGNYTQFHFPWRHWNCLWDQDSGLEVIVGGLIRMRLMLYLMILALSIAVIFSPPVHSIRKIFLVYLKRKWSTMQKHKCTKLESSTKYVMQRLDRQWLSLSTDSFFGTPADRLVRLLASRGVKTYQICLTGWAQLPGGLLETREGGRGHTHWTIRCICCYSFEHTRLDNIVSIMTLPGLTRDQWSSPACNLPHRLGSSRRQQPSVLQHQARRPERG